MRLGETGGGPAPTPPVRIETCRCGCARPDHLADDARPGEPPEWPLATAWAWLTRPVPPADRPAAGSLDELPGEALGEGLGEPPAEPTVTIGRADVPWWDARSRTGRRRAVLPLVLLGELQAGVLLRALYELVKGKTGSPV